MFLHDRSNVWSEVSDPPTLPSRHSAVAAKEPPLARSFDDGTLAPIRLEETSHFQITKGILDSPGRYWKHLLAEHEPG
jgi:hypothetical protein